MSLLLDFVRSPKMFSSAKTILWYYKNHVDTCLFRHLPNHGLDYGL